MKCEIYKKVVNVNRTIWFENVSKMSFVEGMKSWRRRVVNARGITALLRGELYKISDLYDVLSLQCLELYQFNCANDEEVVFKGGEIQSDQEKTVKDSELNGRRTEYELKMKVVQKQIDDIISCRMKLLTCEISSLRSKLKKSNPYKKRKIRAVKAIDGNVMEIGQVARNYEKLSRE